MPDPTYFVAVIDDDESTCMALSRLLHVAGHEVRIYFSAESFLDDPDRNNARFIVSDIHLRGMSGFELKTKFHQQGSQVPFVFITAHDEEETRAEAKTSGCAGYLRKPFAGSSLLELIKN